MGRNGQLGSVHLGSDDIEEDERRGPDCFLLLRTPRSPEEDCRPAEELEGSTISDTVADRCVWCRFDLLLLRLECCLWPLLVLKCLLLPVDEVTTSLAECRNTLLPSICDVDLEGRRSSWRSTKLELSSNWAIISLGISNFWIAVCGDCFRDLSEDCSPSCPKECRFRGLGTGCSATKSIPWPWGAVADDMPVFREGFTTFAYKSSLLTICLAPPSPPVKLMVGFCLVNHSIKSLRMAVISLGPDD